jgi:hypothetical protein
LDAHVLIPCILETFDELTKKGDYILPKGSPVAARLELGSELPSPDGGVALHYGVTNLAGGGAMMVIAGLMSGLLGIG